MIDLFIKAYEKLYRKIENNNRFSLSVYDKEKISEFVLNNDIFKDNESITTYLCLQFSNYKLSKTNIQLNWIIGNKAVLRWKNKTDTQIYYAQKLKHEIGIKSNNKVNKVVLSKEYLNIQRKLFFNKEEGFLNCNELSLFDNKNEYCKKCIFYEECERMC